MILSDIALGFHGDYKTTKVDGLELRFWGSSSCVQKKKKKREAQVVSHMEKGFDSMIILTVALCLYSEAIEVLNH